MKAFRILAILTVLASALPALAQGIDIHGGYQYQSFNPHTGSSTNLNGWTSGAQWRLLGGQRFKLCAAVDFGGAYGQKGGVKLSQYTYLAGARVARGYGRWSGFAHVLAGNAQLSARQGSLSDSTSSLALAYGGGVDYRLNRRLSLRPVRLDLLTTRHAHVMQYNFRYSTELVWSF